MSGMYTTLPPTQVLREGENREKGKEAQFSVLLIRYLLQKKVLLQ